ncbi:hypothetical protein [Zobellella maritima]|uniref:hypothetical protein n=1 Tax=Zobellella maritima TaxID=2059725 RepID=UPI001300B067|nr:hypothetical protein [Zobellella maritima]
MSVPLRYQHPSIVGHLAQRYVLGVQTFRVRRRCRTLSRRVPALALAIRDWQERLHPLSEGTAVQPAAAVWSGIEQRLWGPSQQSQMKLWRSLFALAAGLLLAVSLWLWQAPALPPGPHYIAALNGPVESVQWVVNVTRLKPGVVRLGIEGEHWTEQPMALWAQGRDGNWLLLGRPGSNNREWSLDKARWLAVAEAERLVLTTSVERTPEQSGWLSEGPCLQLREWL